MSLCPGNAVWYCWQIQWAELRSRTAGTSIQSVLTAPLCSFPGGSPWRWFQSWGNCSRHLLTQAHTAGSRAWVTLPSWEAWECGGSQEQHAGDTWEQRDHSWQLCVARTYHSSTIQSLGNPLAAIGKAVLKHGNITKHNNFKKKFLWIFRSLTCMLGILPNLALLRPH